MTDLDDLRQRVAELELARDPAAMRREGLVRELLASATRLVRIERDDARSRLAAVVALHEDDGNGRCTVCVELLPAYWPCPTVRAARGETP